MAYSNVPVNGWPQIKDLEKLDAIAQQIAGMPTFTSNDKVFLEDLPAYPDTDGSKVLTATTSSGETVLSWKNKESGVDYSTTEQATGQKWIDGKDIYFKTIVLSETVEISVNSWTSLGISAVNMDTLINATLYFADGIRGAECRIMDSLIKAMSLRTSGSSDTFEVTKAVIYYTKTT